MVPKITGTKVEIHGTILTCLDLCYDNSYLFRTHGRKDHNYKNNIPSNYSQFSITNNLPLHWLDLCSYYSIVL